MKQSNSSHPTSSEYPNACPSRWPSVKSAVSALVTVGSLAALGMAAIPAASAGASVGSSTAAVAGSASSTGSTSVVAQDSFSRTVVGGLGAANIGGSYVLAAGATKPVSVSGGQAHVTALAPGGSFVAYLPAAVATNAQAQISLTAPAGRPVPVGLYSSVDLRRQADGSAYRVKIKVDAGGVLGLRIAHVKAGGSEVVLGTLALPIKLAVGHTVTLSAQVVGSNPAVVSARAWLDGSAAPAWQLVTRDAATDAVTRKGAVGLWNYLSAGNPAATFAESSFRAVSLDAVSRGSVPVGTAAYPVPAGAIYVSNGNGNDGASGAVSAPLKTIGAAISKAASGQTIVVRAGTYHESLTVGVSKTNLTIQAYPNEAVWLDGSSVVTGWTQRGTTWVHSGWTKRFDHSASFTTGSNAGGFVNPAYPMAAWPDQVFVGGQQLDQVGSAAQVGPGKFAVDYTAQTITVGTNPNGIEVRSSDLEQAFNVITTGVTLRGFGVHRYGTPLPVLATVRLAGGNDTARDLVISDNATQGLSFRNQGDIADHVTALNNGMTGIHGNYADHLTVTNSVVTGNNAEHFNESPSSAGIKVTRSRVVAITNSDFVNNLSKGVWLDESVVGFTIANNMLSGNLTGITTELSDTGVIANNSVNGGSRGLWIFDTGNVKVFNNYFVNNPIGAIFLNQDQRREADPAAVGHDPRQPIPDPTCTWLTRNLVVANNVIGKSSVSSMFQFYALDKSTRISADSMNLTINGNLFTYRAASTDPTMVGWGGSDNVTVTKYYTPATFEQAKGASWTNMQTSPGVALPTNMAFTVPVPADVASVIGVPAGIHWVGTF